MSHLTKHYLDVAGVRLHYITAGSQGPALVLFHETPRSWSSYGPSILRLSEFCRVIIFDSPGYGSSDSLPEDASFADYASVLRQGAEKLVGERYWAGGIHTGAGLAVEVHHQNPHGIAGMILSGLPLYNVVEPAPDIAKVAPEILSTSNGTHIEKIGALIHKKWGGSGQSGAYHDAFQAFVQCFDRYAAIYEALFAYLPPALEPIICPTLFISSEKDVLYAHDRVAVRRIPGAEIVVAPGVGRDLGWAAPYWYSENIRMFVTDRL